MKAKEFRMFPINRICPKCGSGNWMRGMEGPDVGELDIKCLNCFSYFKSAELYSDILANKGANMNKEEILELIDKMISEWDSVKTWAGICKRNALKELKDEIIRRDEAR